MPGVVPLDHDAIAFAPGEKRRQSLHHVEGFVNRDLRAAPDDGTRLRKLRRLVQGRRLDDAVTARALPDRSLCHRAVGVDLVDRAGKRVAGIDHRGAELGEPRGPLLHDPSLLRRRVRHAAAVIDQQIFHSFFLLAVFERKSAINASARFNRSRLAGSFSQRLWPDGCGRGTMTGRWPKRLPTRSSSEPGPRKREIAIWPTGIRTFGLRSFNSASSQCAQLATPAGGARRSPVLDLFRPGKQRISAAMYVSRRISSGSRNPARIIQRSSSLPARPEKGRRVCLSAGPGAWPTRKNGAPHSPENVGLASA